MCKLPFISVEDLSIIIDLVIDTSAVMECIPNWTTLKEAKLAEIGIGKIEKTLAIDLLDASNIFVLKNVRIYTVQCKADHDTSLL